MRSSHWDDHRRARAAARAVHRALALGVTVLALAACDLDRLLESSRPSTLDADKLGDPKTAALLVNGAQADFECGHGAFVAAEALMGDELEDAQLAAAVWPYDRRDFTAAPSGIYGTGICEDQLFGVYTPLSTARWSADDVLRKLEAWTDEQVPNRTALIAKAAVYAGFSLAELGMIMCSAAIDVGPEMSSEELFQEAEARFTRAIETAEQAGETDLLSAAYAGRARVRLYLGDNTGALADAQQVPSGFAFYAQAEDVSEDRRWNRIFHFVNFSGYHMVEEGSRGLTTGGEVDPRTLVEETDVRALDGRAVVAQTKYTSLGDPMPVTRYEEAQLIIAEVEGGSTAVGIINALRDQYGLPHVSAAEQADLQQTILEERRRELWLEGQRLYDIRRAGLTLTPAPGTTFLKGGSYGTTVCLPLPDVERFNNPNIS